MRRLNKAQRRDPCHSPRPRSLWPHLPKPDSRPCPSPGHEASLAQTTTAQPSYTYVLHPCTAPHVLFPAVKMLRSEMCHLLT